VIACCRTPQDCADLVEHNDNQNRVVVIPLDLEDQSTIEAAGATIRQKYHRVDLLLNVAGILGDGTTTPGPERSITKLSRTWLERTMAINVIGPVMLTKELIPLLQQQQQKRARQNPPQAQRPKSVVANLSARVGSISDNTLGGWYSYRMSKAALNMATRTLALELKRHAVHVIALHPGTTNTDLSKPFQQNVKPGSLFPVEFTVQQLLHVIEATTEEHSGGLYDWAGKSISF
jgi:NAD(P)-dependent dehydrogenase (short-subunit alcohol dehydrogenase family)